MAKPGKSDVAIQRELDRVNDIVREIERAFRHDHVTIAQGLMTAVILLGHGIDQARADEDRAYGEMLRAHTLDALRSLQLVIERPEAFPPGAWEIPTYRM